MKTYCMLSTQRSIVLQKNYCFFGGQTKKQCFVIITYLSKFIYTDLSNPHSVYQYVKCYLDLIVNSLLGGEN